MVTPRFLTKIYNKAEDWFREKSIIAGKSGRHMKFPYTFSAKVAQFPLFFYMKNNNIWMYWPVGWFITFLVFVKIHRLANSSENKSSWAETQRKNAAHEKEH